MKRVFEGAHQPDWCWAPVKCPTFNLAWDADDWWTKVVPGLHKAVEIIAKHRSGQTLLSGLSQSQANIVFEPAQQWKEKFAGREITVMFVSDQVVGPANDKSYKGVTSAGALQDYTLPKEEVVAVKLFHELVHGYHDVAEGADSVKGRLLTHDGDASAAEWAWGNDEELYTVTGSCGGSTDCVCENDFLLELGHLPKASYMDELVKAGDKHHQKIIDRCTRLMTSWGQLNRRPPQSASPS
jgi:hypothetical protein